MSISCFEAANLVSFEPQHQTPPHHPIHGVHFSDSTIQSILGDAAPDAKIASVTKLPSGRSFNKRIYFLKLRQTPPGTDTVIEHDLVLRTNGRFFGPDKIQNEVASLRLLGIHCPEVPTPWVWAWSEAGKDIVVLSPNHGSLKETRKPSSVLGENGEPLRDWILMTRVPGEPTSTAKLDETAMRHLGTQLAELVESWRRNIPKHEYCGNILLPASADLGTEAFPMAVRGILADAIEVSDPIATDLDYHKIRLKDKLKQLETKDLYSPSRVLVPLLRSFIAETLPKLRLVNAANGKALSSTTTICPPEHTHLREPPDISGVVDFEFADFFPTLGEFVNDYVDNGGDWLAEAYKAYLERLGQLNAATPAKGIEKEVWEEAASLGKLLENIVPWWLPGGHTGKELENELRKSELIAKDMIKTLARSAEGSSQ